VYAIAMFGIKYTVHPDAHHFYVSIGLYVLSYHALNIIRDEFDRLHRTCAAQINLARIATPGSLHAAINSLERFEELGMQHDALKIAYQELQTQYSLLQALHDGVEQSDRDGARCIQNLCNNVPYCAQALMHARFRLNLHEITLWTGPPEAIDLADNEEGTVYAKYNSRLVTIKIHTRDLDP
jgi:hypothetical protein